MKRIISLILVLATVLSFTACGCDHTWLEATCTTAKTCSTCNATEGESLGHTWAEATCTAPKTCSVCQATEGEVGDHTWENATCTTPKTCSTCNTTEGESLGHTWAEANCVDPKTCSTCKTTEGTALGHTWKNATCTTPKTCSVCNATEGGNGSHTWKNATCTTPKTCSVCKTTEGSALGCTQGSDGKCIRCGKSMVSISSVLSKPLDTLAEVKKVATSAYYYGDCYSAGNFRLIFNTANGVILSWGATNTSSKEIKYITFTVHYYNAVADPAKDSITGSNTKTVKLTGPIGAGKAFYFRQLIGYGSDIYYAKIKNVKIEYMDGTSVSGDYGYTTWHNIRTSASPKECFIIQN